MPSRAQVLALLDSGHSFQATGTALKIAPGQAFMIATGVPADGSDTPHPDELRDRPPISASTQNLVNPPPLDPSRNAHVLRWAAQRASRELTQPQ